MRYKIKESIKIFKKENSFSFLFMNKHLEIEVESNCILQKLMELIDLSYPIKDIYIELKKLYSDIEFDEVNTLVIQLQELGIIEADVNPNMTKEDLLFLDRHLNFLSDYMNGTYNQYQLHEFLSKAKIVILGIGAIGSWIAYNLVQSGIKNLILIDPDTISKSNLSRQSLYFNNDIGKLKVDVLKKNLESIHENLNIEVYTKKMNTLEDLDMLSDGIDIFINCADSPDAYTTGAIVSEYCIPRGITNINGIGYRGNICSLGLTNIPNQSICWKCLNSLGGKIERGEYLEFDNHFSSAGSTSTITTLIASIHAWEVIKILIPTMTPSLINRKGKFNLDSLSIEWEDIQPVGNCNLCTYGRENRNDSIN